MIILGKILNIMASEKGNFEAINLEGSVSLLIDKLVDFLFPLGFNAEEISNLLKGLILEKRLFTIGAYLNKIHFIPLNQGEIFKLNSSINDLIKEYNSLLK